MSTPNFQAPPRVYRSVQNALQACGSAHHEFSKCRNKSKVGNVHGVGAELFDTHRPQMWPEISKGINQVLSCHEK